MSERETKSFDDAIDIEDIANVSMHSKKASYDKTIIQSVAEKSSFSSRGDNKKKPRKRSPYVIQKNIKMRVGMSELLADITEAVKSGSDQETLEKALLALIEKEGKAKLKQRYMELIDN